MATIEHKDITGEDAIHPIMYVTGSDPGAVGANKFWLDTTGGASLETGAILKQRNGTNDGWTTRADFSGGVDGGDADTLDGLDSTAFVLQTEVGAADGVASLTSGAKVTPTELSADVKTETASYTLVLADAGKWIRMNVASANDLTVPTNASVAFPVDTEVHVEQMGAGQTTIVASGGVTIRTPETLLLAKQYAAATLKKVATDEWVLAGYLEAAP